jgi:ferric-dicitrate binding protein FerR (iron transport regulator)
MARPARTGQLCDRAREWVSLRVDGELSELEGALLEAHLKRCAGCREFADDLAGLTGALRAAALDPLTAPIMLPRRTRVSLRAFQATAAAAAVVLAAGLGSLFGVLRSDGGARPSAPHLATVVAFDESANTMRALRREALIVQGKGRIPRNRDTGV